MLAIPELPASGSLSSVSSHSLSVFLSATFDYVCVLDNPQKLHDRFIDVMTKMSLLGQDQSQLIDCSEVIPVPKAINVQATFPAGLSNNDIEQAVRSLVYHSYSALLTGLS